MHYLKSLLAVGLVLVLLAGCSHNIENSIKDKLSEFEKISSDFTLQDAENEGFYVQDSIPPQGAPSDMIRFIEHIWQRETVDVSIATEKDGSIILSYLIYKDDVISVLDYNTSDGKNTVSEYKYLTYDYASNGIQSRYLTNDKNLDGKDTLTEEEKSESYFLCSYR